MPANPFDDLLDTAQANPFDDLLDTASQQKPVENPGMLRRGLQFVGRQVDRVSAAPLRGAEEAIQNYQPEGGGKFHPGVVIDALKGAGRGFMNPDQVQSGQQMFARMGVSDAPSSQLQVMGTSGKPMNLGQDRPAGDPSLAATLGAAQDILTPIPGLGLVTKGGAAALKSETAGKLFNQAQKISNLPNKAAGKLAQELSSVSEEALRMATTKEGRAALKANAGKEYEIGQRLVNMLDNPKEFAPNKELIDNALKGMGDVNITPVIKALEDAKISRPSGKMWAHEKVANDAIQQDINDLLGKNKSTVLPAQEALDLRRGMDDVIDHNGNQKQLDIVNKAKLKARKAMKEVLESKAAETGNHEYVQGMSELHKQFEARDRLMRFLGKNKAAQEDRAESFISNMWGKNRKNRQKVMQDIGEAFGKDFLEESKLANLASQLGPEGEATWFSRAPTGRSRLAGAVGFVAGGSPKLATRVILPLAEMPPKMFKWLEGLSKAKTAAEKSFYAGNLAKAGMSEVKIKAALAAMKEGNQ